MDLWILFVDHHSHWHCNQEGHLFIIWHIFTIFQVKSLQLLFESSVSACPRGSKTALFRLAKFLLEALGPCSSSFTFLCCSCCFVCLRSVSCAQVCLCVWIALSWLSLRFSLACMYFHSFFFLCKLSYDLVLSANLFINNREEFRRCWLEQISCEIKTWLKLCMLNIT